jgi:hypothetical protein
VDCDRTAGMARCTDEYSRRCCGWITFVTRKVLVPPDPVKSRLGYVRRRPPFFLDEESRVGIFRLHCVTGEGTE